MALKDKVILRLTTEHRQSLERVMESGPQSASLQRRANTLLLADADGPEDWTEYEALNVIGNAVVRSF